MGDRQLDFFSGGGFAAAGHAPPAAGRRAVAPAALDDAALIVAIPDAGLADGPALAVEAGQRRLAAAVPALVRLCRRLAGFGRDGVVPEQAAALEALAAIAGPEAAQAVAGILASGEVQGPGLRIAAAAAARLRSALPAETVGELLRHDDPAVRADGCRCAGLWPAAIPVLGELLEDLNTGVRAAAACALGRLGRPEAAPILRRLLLEAPSPEVIEAVAGIADEDSPVLLRRVAGERPDLAPAVLDALDMIDTPQAERFAAAIRAGRPEPE
jgi:HEAT repeat protein